MRKTVLVSSVIVLFLCSSSAWAVGFLGAPTAEFGEGRFSTGWEYSYSRQGLQNQSASIWGIPGRVKLRDFRVNRHYATLGYGVTSDWDVYMKLGIADAKAKSQFWVPGYDRDSHNFNNRLAIGWGTRYTFHKTDNVSWGGSLQMNWLNTSSSKTGLIVDGNDTNRWKDSTSLRVYDIILSAGPTVRMEGWKLYGGPFFYYLGGDMTAKGTDGTNIYRSKVDIRSESHIGGFIGAEFAFVDNITTTVEMSMLTTGGWGIGTGIAYKF